MEQKRKYPKVKDNNEYYERKLGVQGGFFNAVATIVERYKQPYSNEDNAAIIFNAIVDFANTVMAPIADGFDYLNIEYEGLKDENEKLKQEKAAVEKIFGIEELNEKVEDLTKAVEYIQIQISSIARAAKLNAMKK